MTTTDLSDLSGWPLRRLLVLWSELPSGTVALETESGGDNGTKACSVGSGLGEAPGAPHLTPGEHFSQPGSAQRERGRGAGGSWTQAAHQLPSAPRPHCCSVRRGPFPAGLL